MVENGEVLNLDPDGAADRLSAAQRRMEEGCPERDYEKRSALEVVPLSLPLADAPDEAGSSGDGP